MHPVYDFALHMSPCIHDILTPLSNDFNRLFNAHELGNICLGMATSDYILHAFTKLSKSTTTICTYKTSLHDQPPFKRSPNISVIVNEVIRGNFACIKSMRTTKSIKSIKGQASYFLPFRYFMRWG